MFARKLRVEYLHNGELLPCPLKWLDNFAMRNFTNAQVFDDTLPVSDGCLEDWFRRKSYLPKDARLMIKPWS